MRKGPPLLHAIAFLLLIFLSAHLISAGQVVEGKVTDILGRVVPYASVYVKGGTRGTTSNNEGSFFLALDPGNYTIVCAHVGFKKSEQTVHAEPRTRVELSFTLDILVTELKEVVVKPNGENPAYSIIRNAIKARKEHLNEVDEWQSTVYMKGMIKSLQLPKKILGIKVDPNRDIIDSSGKGIVYFSESLTRYSRRLPSDYKEEVVSAKVSGMSQGFGFNSPHDMEVNLYENNLSLSGLNNRGFISPIADNALYFYRYRYLGTFYEDGLEINKIQVMPRRLYEPCFAGGYVNIIEGTWRIHSFDLFLTKESQMEVIDSLRLQQQMFPVGPFWMPLQTNLEAGFGMLGVRAHAQFMAVYSDYNLESLPERFFRDNVVRVIDTAANKKSVQYWDSIRPSPLTAEERMDYLKKDTLERRMKQPRYLDSMQKRSNRTGLMELLITGNEYQSWRKKITLEYPSLIQAVQYNTVEGWLVDISPTIRRWSDTNNFVIRPHLRYGFSSRHFNASASITHNVGNNYRKRWRITLNGGKYIFQINPNNPIKPWVNTFATLLRKRNYMKIYENIFGSVSAQHNFHNGFRINVAASYEDRIPLENTDTTYSWVKSDRSFTSNYPEEIPPGNFVRHQALLTSVKLTWQPGQEFIAYPKRMVSLGSEQPIFTISLTKAWNNILAADADFGKWMLGMRDELNMKLAGDVYYNLSIGGFIRNDNVQLPDWQHFNGNQTIIATEYLNSFQLAPYYANSTNENFYTTGNIEWHLNGLFTNKIPLLRRFNLGLVTGSNAFYVDSKRNYVEMFFGIENIFKSLRIDFVWGYDGFNRKPTSGFVLGFSGIFTGQGVE